MMNIDMQFDKVKIQKSWAVIWPSQICSTFTAVKKRKKERKIHIKKKTLLKLEKKKKDILG